MRDDVRRLTSRHHDRGTGTLEPGQDNTGNAKRDEMRRSLSIVLQDNHVQLTDIFDKTTEALGNSYRFLREHSKKVKETLLPTHTPPPISSSKKASVPRTHDRKPPPFPSPHPSSAAHSRTSRSSLESRKDDASPPRAPRAEIAPFGQKSLSFDSVLRRRRQVHLQSADLFENFSPVQKERQLWMPGIPDVFNMGPTTLIEVSAPELVQADAAELEELHARTFRNPCLEIQPAGDKNYVTQRPLRLGIILSGGPAPGGHNVIAGAYDYIKQIHSESQLFGFMGGLDGLFQQKYRLVTDDLMDRFRNTGGFDMLWSGRGRVNGKEDMVKAASVCGDLTLDGLVMVGGDGSNSNAALLSEFFAENLPTCPIVGIPKTIDGDLRNPWVETSFGFDTAAKTYSELIGNLCTDVCTGQQVYHFIRVMGRSASHLVMECALQTRPNLVFIGEEVEKKNITLQQIVESVLNLILDRLDVGKSYGIVLVPEGLIEFIPEIKALINELNQILGKQQSHDAVVAHNVRSLLSESSQKVWDFLPDSIQEQLLMDREASGYIQVAKIATERLLKLLVEAELAKREALAEDIGIMTHYFGYEGRCAMPSNFDASYCYALGQTAATLVEHERNGYLCTVRHLDQHVAMWQPSAVPFTRVMEMKVAADNSRFPAVKRQLVDLEGPLFKVLDEVRDTWRMEDCYRVPGPIQFEGPVADIADYTVTIPAKSDLLWGISSQKIGEGRAICPKRPGALSELQRQRLQYIPDIPDVCKNVQARAIVGSQYLPKDPFTQRQILTYYPHVCSKNHFHLREVVVDKETPSCGKGLRVGVVFLSRQSPGVMNVLWGVHQRLKLVEGTCIGFFGVDGLLQGKYLEITDKDLEMYVNQGGMELLGRAATHSLLLVENQDKARATCEKLELDGLIVVGSSLAVMEAALTAEYFLANGLRTAVIGIPATGSNNLTHDLIEANIGFDTSSKVYASLVGNVLTDAASMPKYWHFVRLMGRQPSYEVLECALQTHPNVVIIAEEYGAANKTLADVVSDIADVVCRRADQGKNFGSVLIPDSLLSHIPNMKTLMDEFGAIVREADAAGELKELNQQLMDVDSFAYSEGPGSKNVWLDRVTPWSLALFRSLPKFIRRELTQLDMGEMRFTLLETELLLSQMVKEELERRRKAGRFTGKFAAVCHFFGYQGRSSMPSQFDSRLAYAYGHLAAILVESGVTASCCSIRGLVGDIKDWKLGAIPFDSMFSFVASQDDIHPDLRGKQADKPTIPSAEVKLTGKAYHWMKTAVGQWQMQDRFCNPGPIQFKGKPSTFYHRMLHEEQAEYFNMLQHVQLYTGILNDTCSFGVDENFLKVCFANLNGLLALRFHPDDLMSHLQPITEVETYGNWQSRKGYRPEAWRESNGRRPTEVESEFDDKIVPIPVARAPSVIGQLAGQRLHSKVLSSREAPEETIPEDAAVGLQRTSGSRHDAGWGDLPGVEEYPRSRLASD